MSQKQPAHRPTRLYPDAERRLLRPDVEVCPACETPLSNTGTLYLHKYVQTLDGPVEVRAYGFRCPNPNCPQPQARYHAQWNALQVSLPFGTYGIDVVAWIGWQRDYEHRQFVEIQRHLNRRAIAISERHVGRLYRDYLALVSGLTHEIAQRLEQVVREHGSVIWAVDALQPEASGPLFYVLYEVRSQTPVLGSWLTQRDRDHLVTWLAPVVALKLPVGATLSDGEEALVGALQQSWPDTPHQRCQMHFLKAWADPLKAADRHLRAGLREALKLLLPDLPDEAEQVMLVSSPAMPAMSVAAPEPVEAPAPEAPSPRQHQLLALIDWAFRDCVRRPGRTPLLFGGLRRYEQLEQLVATLTTHLAGQEATPLHPYLQAGHQALRQNRALAEELRTAQARLAQAACLLAHPSSVLPPETPPDEVGSALQTHLTSLVRQWRPSPESGGLYERAFVQAGLGLLERWGRELFHCYTIPGLPPSNTDLEALFGDLRRHQRRLSGRKETTPLQRHAQVLIWRLATSCEHLTQLLRSVSLQAFRTARPAIHAAEARARWRLALRRHPANAFAAVVSEFLQHLPALVAPSLALAA